MEKNMEIEKKNERGSTMNYWNETPHNIYVAAHRGWSEVYPENTMEAFRAACELGVDQIETDVRVTGRVSMGVIGMKLEKGDEVVTMQMTSQGDDMLIASELGMGKRTRMDEFSPQNRGGKGVKCYKIHAKTGNVVGGKAVKKDQELMLITTEGIVIRIPVNSISRLGRITSGVKLINLAKGVKLASIAKVRAGDTSADLETDVVSDATLEKMKEEM